LFYSLPDNFVHRDSVPPFAVRADAGACGVGLYISLVIPRVNINGTI
jgi:hypothetical protein